MSTVVCYGCFYTIDVTGALPCGQCFPTMALLAKHLDVVHAVAPADWLAWAAVVWL